MEQVVYLYKYLIYLEMATVRFFTRTIKKDKNSSVPLWVRVKSGRKIDLTCKADVLIKVDNWSNDTQLVKQRSDYIFKSNLNDKLAGLRKAIETGLNETHQDEMNAKWLTTTIDKHWHPEKYKTTLFNFIQSFIDKAKTKPITKTGRPVSYKTYREYEVSFEYLKKYAKQIKKEPDFKDIDLNFYDKYIQFLQATVKPNKDPDIKQKIAVNTIGKKIRVLKQFLNAAKEEGKNPFEAYWSKNFVATFEESESIYLNESELNTLYKIKLTDAKDRVRDIFLVGCWTGCRFSDIAQITPESISGGFIYLKQYKTGKKVVIPLHPIVTAILNKYGGKLPGLISNQKFNEALKEIAKEAKINEPTHKAMTRGGVKTSLASPKYKLVTTHTARRSFATNLYKSGFPSISIMAITGHVTEKSFLKYIKLTPEEHAKKLQDHWDNRHLKVVS